MFLSRRSISSGDRESPARSAGFGLGRIFSGVTSAWAFMFFFLIICKDDFAFRADRFL